MQTFLHFLDVDDRKLQTLLSPLFGSSAEQELLPKVLQLSIKVNNAHPTNLVTTLLAQHNIRTEE
jgi:hypothetical protein